MFNYLELMSHFAIVIGVFAIVLGAGVLTSRATGVHPAIVFSAMAVMFWIFGEVLKQLTYKKKGSHNVRA